MANGEGVVEEVLVKGRYDGSEIEKGIPESVEKGVAAADKETQKARANIMRFAKAFREQGVSASVAREELSKFTSDTKLVSEAMKEAGYSSKELTGELDEEKGAWNRVAGAVKFAVFRFFTALIIYQALRRILRSINEAIKESIRLWREFSQAQQVLTANLEANARILGQTVDTLEEWNRWIKEMSDAYGASVRIWTQATNAALQHNLVVGKTNEELKDLIVLGRDVAIMWGLWKDEQPDIEKGVNLVMQAIQGEEAALKKLGITQAQIIEYAKEQGIEWDILTDAMKQQVTWAYIMTQRSEELGQAVQESYGGVEQASTKVVAANENLMISWGRLWAKLVEGIRLIRLIVTGPLVWLSTKYFEVMEASFNLAQSTGELIGKYTALGPALRAVGSIIDRLAPSFLKTTEAQEELTEATKEGADAALRSARIWSYYKGIIDRVPSGIKAITDRLRDMVDKVKEAAQPYIDLGRAIGDAMIDNLRAAEDAARNFGRRMADLAADLARDIARLGRRFAARAEELVIRAEERKEQIRQEFRDREQEERDDLHLRLKHMEEDFLLDMKHMREQYEMDIEEAARARDWRAIRTLQRRYGLEKRQRGEDYELQRKQFIESWNQRHKQRKKDLEKELKEVEDNLARQLAALERERKRELEEIKIRHQERKEELRQQYAEELQDLQRNLERRLSDILTAAIQEGTIRMNEAMKVTQTLAYFYGIDMQNLETMVRHDIQWLGAWAGAWDAALLRITQARSAFSGVTMGGQFYPYPTAPFAFAKGGMAVATKPTLVKVGEAGPELFTAIPLAKGGSVLGGLRNQMGGDFRLTIDGNQAGAWSPDFEQGVTNIVAEIFREAFEE